MADKTILDFEEPIANLEQRIKELEQFAAEKNVELAGELGNIKKRLDQLITQRFQHLTPWQRVRIARHPDRPQTEDIVSGAFTEFMELFGDRNFGDDRAILAGFARLEDERVMLIGHRKGKGTKDKLSCNFGSAHPEGYRKALLKMRLAERMHLPIITLIDTMGASCDMGAEERGQAHAIAQNLMEMFDIHTPILCLVIGEGGSGGAIGIGIGDRILMAEHAYYSVISPEGCASILWKDTKFAESAAAALKITSNHLLRFGVIDEIIPEPMGGAHRNPKEFIVTLKENLLKNLRLVKTIPPGQLLETRYQKFRKMGILQTPVPVPVASAKAPEQKN